VNNDPISPVEIIERIMQTAKAVVPESLGDDVKDNLRAAIQNIISDLDVVAREEFDIQSAVLAKTRAKVDEMEKVIVELEKRLSVG